MQKHSLRGLRRLAGAALATALLAALVQPALAAFPHSATGSDTSDPYAYHEYMYITPDQYPPNDIQPNNKEHWIYSSETACELYGSTDPRCSALVNENPQELFGVTGASIDRAWETTTGRPDVVIAVHDSGIKWDDVGAMRDLNNTTWLNRGELPLPDWGTPHPNDPHDVNGDGVFNIRDYCPDWNDARDCGGQGDSRVRGNPSHDFNANGIIDPEDLIFLFSDGLDDDGNGYVDDISGWDAFEDDNDPYDEVQYGHGTGEARDSVAEMDNDGTVGVCPNCMVMHVRVGDSFIADVNDFAQGVLYSVDNGASVIQSALGTLNNSRFAQEAIEYAWQHGVILIASAADESAGHHNQPSVLERAVTFNSVGEPQLPGAQPPSYLEFRGCTNYGAYITAAVPSNSCSSEAVGRSAGMAGLIYGAARNEVVKGNIDDYGTLDGPGGVPAGHALSAEEADQVIKTTADDIDFHNPLLYTARPTYPATERYPATTGWDPFFGFGRVNAERMVRAVSEGKIPPEADITSPVWFATVDPDDGPIQIEGDVASRRSEQYSYEVTWGLWSWRDTNAPPAYISDGVTLAHEGDLSDPVSGPLATIDPADVVAAMTLVNGPQGTVSGPAVDPVTGRGDHENRQLPDKFGVIVRLEVTAKEADGSPLEDIDGGPLTGVANKNFNLHRDPALFDGFPIDLEGDGAASPRFADLDNEGVDEMIVATSNGEVHAYKADGSQAAGWPVTTTPLDLDYDAPAYRSGQITTPIHAAVLRSPTIGDIDRDGDLEVFVADFHGRIWGYDHAGEVLDGFPVRSDPRYSAPQKSDRAAGFYAANPGLVPGDYPGPGPLPNDPDLVPDLVNRHDKVNRLSWWFLAAPVLANVDPSDDDLELVAGAGDRHIYVFKSDGSTMDGWPVMLRDPDKVDGIHPVRHTVTHNESDERYNGAKVIVSPAVGDLDADGKLDIVATVNEQYREPVNSDDPALADIVGQLGIVTSGNNRLYALHTEGAAAGDGPGEPENGHPNANAFREGWPARIATLSLELLPVVGNGPDGSPVLGDVTGDGNLEIGIFGTAGPAYILDKDGDSIYGKDGSGRDRTLRTAPLGAAANSQDGPTIPAVGGGIFVDLLGQGLLNYAAPSAGLGKLLDLVLPEDQLVSDNHLSVWDLEGTRALLPAFPREVNDLQFLTTPAAADIDGDGLEEILEGTAYSDLHAFNVLGEEPGLRTLSSDGWPKFTGGWTVAPPAVGDFDGDGTRDIAHVIREGRLFAWTGNGAEACDPASWPEFGHDNWNSNNYSTDAIRPAVVTDLDVEVVDDATARLTWTAPGDDGPCGTAHSYEVRRVESRSAPGFASGDEVEGAPEPASGGSDEAMEVTRECDGFTVAVRAFDADPTTQTEVQPANVSAPSNLVEVPGSAAACDPDVDPSPTPTGSPSPSPSPSESPSPDPSPTDGGSPGPSPSETPDPSPTAGGPPEPSPTASASPEPGPSLPGPGDGDLRVTLETSRRRAPFRATVVLSGTVSAEGDCPVPGRVEILRRVHGTQNFEPLGEATIGRDGDFSRRLRPHRNATYYVTAEDPQRCVASSQERPVLVNAGVEVRRARCAPKAGVAGRVRPSHPGTRVVLQKKTNRGWKRFARKRLDARFRFSFGRAPCRRARVRWPKQSPANQAGGARFRPR